MRSYRRLTAFGLLLGILPLLVPGGASGEVEVPPDAAIPSSLPNGDSYDHRAATATALASDLTIELDALEGFAGIVLEGGATTRVVVRWRGTPPEPAQRAVRRASGRGVEASLRSAKYTARALNALAQETSRMVDPTLDQNWYLSAYAAPDSSGLVVGTAKESSLHSMSTDEVASLLNIPVPIKLEVAGTAGDSSEDLSRLSDYGSFDGGARISNRSCSTGFTIIDYNVNAQGMLTAQHCGGVGTVVKNDGNTKGEIKRTSATRDIAIIRGYASGYSSYVYEGSYTSASRVGQGVLMAPVVGMFACVSGSYSGELCGVEVRATNEYVGGEGPFVRGHRTSAGGAGGGGDSGGPFMYWVWNSSTSSWRVRPVGLVSQGVAGYELANCAGVATRCYSRVRYANLREATTPMNFGLTWVN